MERLRKSTDYSALKLCSYPFLLMVPRPVQVIYDPQEVQYEKLLDTFFQHVDPTTKDRQGGDRGTQYRSAIYCHTPEQKATAQKVRLLGGLPSAHMRTGQAAGACM